jgi:hypothetical protein
MIMASPIVAMVVALALFVPRQPSTAQAFPTNVSLAQRVSELEAITADLDARLRVYETMVRLVDTDDDGLADEVEIDDLKVFYAEVGMSKVYSAEVGTAIIHNYRLGTAF